MGYKNKLLLVVSIVLLFLIVVTLNTNSKLSCYSTTQTTTDTLVLSLSNYTNAHIEAGNQSNYNYHIYCSDDTYTITTDCNDKNTTILRLSNLTNAHGELASQNNYNYELCLGRDTKPVYCYSTQGNIPSGYAGIIKLSNYTNAHGENVSNNNYKYTIYCGDELTQIDVCTNLTQPGKYVLTKNLFSNSTCIEIQNNSISLDCAGSSITYANNTTGYGIKINSGYSNINISNCILNQTNSSVSSSYAIYSYGSSSNKNYNINLSNITINTSGSSSHGLYFYYSNYNNLSDISVSTYGSYAYDLVFSSSDYNILEDVFANTFGWSAYALFFTSSDFSNLSNVSASTTNTNAYALYFSGSDYNILKDIFVNTSGSSARGLVFWPSSSNNIFNVSVSTSNVDAYALFFYNFDRSNISNVSVFTSGSSASALYFVDSEYNILEDFFVNTSGTGAYALYFDSSNSNNFHNSSINSSSSYDVYFSSSDDYPVVFFSNVSFDNSSVYFADFDSGVLCYNSSIIGKVYVNDTNGNSISDASILVNSNNFASASASKCFVYNSSTDSSGFSDVKVYDFMQNFSGVYSLKDDVYFEASKFGYNYSYFVGTVFDGFQVNLTLSSVSSGELYGCGVINESGNYTLMRDVSNVSTCFRIEVSDVVFDGKGYEVGYSEGETGHGFLINSGLSNVTIGNVSIIQKSTVSYSYGIFSNGSYFYHDTDISVFNTTINTSGSRSYALFFYYSEYSNISDVEVSTSGDSAYAMYFPAFDFSNLSNVKISTSGIYARGLYFSTSNYNILKDIFVNTSGDSAYAIYFYNSNSNIFHNSSINSSNSYDIYFNGNYNYPTKFINTSFNKSDVYFYDSDSGYLYNGYYVDVYVNDTFGNNLSDVTVSWHINESVYDPNKVSLNGSSLTDSSGWSKNNIVYEYYQNFSGTYYLNNYTFNVSKGSVSNVSYENITDNTKLYYTLQGLFSCINITQPGSYVLQNNVSSQGTCFEIQTNNVELDCNNYNIEYATLTTGYGIKINSGYSNINISNCVLNQSNSSVSASYGIYSLGSSSSKIYNTSFSNITIFTYGSSSYGLYLYYTTNSSIYNFTFNSSNNYAYGFNLRYSDHINANFTFINTSGYRGYSITTYSLNFFNLSNSLLFSSGDYSHTIYASSSSDLKFDNISSKTLGPYTYTVYWYYSNRISFENSFLNSSYSSSHAFYSYESNYVNVSNTSAYTYDSSSHAFFFDYSDYIYLYNCSSSTEGSSSDGLRLNYVSNSQFDYFTTTTSGSSAIGVHTYYSDKINFSYFNSTSYDSALSLSNYLGYSNWFFISNSSFNSSNSYDVSVYGDLYPAWYFNNVSFDNSSVYFYDFDSGVLCYNSSIIGKVYVNDTNGNSISDASILVNSNIYDSTSSKKCFFYDFFTNGSGFSDVKVYDFMQNFSGVYSLKDDVYFEASKIGYNYSYVVDTVSDKFQINLTLGSVPFGEVYSCGVINESGNYSLMKNVSNVSTCFRIEVSNVSFDGKGYEVGYSESEEGYGFYIDSDLKNISIKNTNIKEKSSLSNSHGIYSKGSSTVVSYNNFLNISNNTISTYGSKSYGIYFQDTQYSNISDVSITTSGDSAHGLHFYTSDYSNISNVSVSTSGSDTYADSAYGLYFYYSDNSNLSDISVSTSGSYADGLYFYYSKYNIFSNVSVSTSGSYAEGVYFYYSGYNNLTKVNITSSYEGLYFADSGYNNLSKVNINSSFNGLYFDSSGYNNVNNTTIFTSTSGAEGLTFYSSSYNNISFTSVTTLGLNADGIYFYSSDSIVFFNSSISVSDADDIYFSGNSYPFVNFTNVSFNKSNVGFYDFDSGNLSVNWYLDVKVLNATNNNPLNNANVTVYNSSNDVMFNSTTNSNGLLQDIILQEYYQTYDGFYNNTPLNVSAQYTDASNYEITSFQTNTEITLLLPRDEKNPWWDNNITNETTVNPKKFEFIQLNVSLHDDVSLSSFIFSWNDSGTWVNDSPITIQGTDFVVNVTKNVTSNKNTIVGWKVYFNDTSNNTNETDIFTFKVKNTLPTIPNLSYPENEDYFFINRTPRFNWSESTDLDGDAITYIWQLSLTDDFSTIIAEDNALTTNYKDYGILDFTTYYWHVAACDDEGCSSNSSTFNFTVVPFVNISLQNNNIDFGNINLGEQNDTSDDNPLPITITNTGNVKINVSINATALWQTVSLDTEYYQYKAREKELNAFDTTLSQLTYNNISTTEKLAIAYLNWTDNNSAYIDILVKAPNLGSDEPPGEKKSNLTIIAE